MSNASALPVAQRRAIGDVDWRRQPDTPVEAEDMLNWLHGECRTPSVRNQGPRVAVIGGGISGLGAAWALRQGARTTLFESAARLGGHANTVDLSLDGVTHGVDTGFLVCNARTYPLLLTLFESLGVELAPSGMGFSVQHHGLGLEWAGNDLGSVFAQRRRLLDASFLGMLADLARFNRLTTRIARAGHDAELDEPLQVFLDRHRFGAMFRQAYLLPMIACIWSCPAERMLHFPAGSLIRFCHNHGLLRIRHRPQWMTVRGGSRQYVQKMRAQLPDVREGEPVRRVQRLSGGRVRLHRQDGCEDFDAVVLACHSDQALALLDEPTRDERAVLGAVRYQVNRAVLHLDAEMLPRRRRAWAAWNFEARTGDDAGRPVCLHYLINELQPLPWKRPVIVSMNPLREPRHVQASFDYAHPVLDAAAARAQRRLDAIQGQGGVWYAGAWTGFGFHEDGLRSGLAAARALRRRFAPAWAAA